MTRHIILWQLKDEFTAEQKAKISFDAKMHLEALAKVIDGIKEIKVITEKFDCSNVDLMLDSTFVSEKALDAYRVNPNHVKVADTYVRPFTKARYCIDYNE